MRQEQQDPLQFAVVGCGRIAGRHAEHIGNNGTLVATADAVLERAQAMAEPHSAKAFSSLEEMLVMADEIDVVSVCSPNGLHAEHTIAALQAGCHVLCEKPMAITSYDCGRMIQAAERANRRLFVVKQNRFNPPVAAVKQALDEGRLGKLYSIGLNCFWNRNPAYYTNDPWKGSLGLDGGTLYTQFSHFIDLMYWMAGDVEDAAAFSDNFCHQETVEFEDCGAAVLRFRSGALGTVNYTINSYGKNMEGSLTIFAEKGTVKIGGQYLNEMEYQNIEDYEITGLGEGKPANQYGHYVGSMSNHDEVYANVVEVLTKGGVIATNGYEGLKTVEIIEKIYKGNQWNQDLNKLASVMSSSAKT
ncbi:Gfo/Idh/MocA family protein [Neorhodopirellula pilleata]|uniref:Putative oxidoreductase YcjS n=1 Tax=Neorhodopirellula pilleata TaxID=2714738 RepID=A0A5C6AAU6_9BACT|nr:Gfo/Idh/MocA family oxidoreductase [Neorhodopirellula pilleata]TWT96275.1 putative oxidoreductase YcjS [Neorhodopirellula pilleata]